MQIKRTEVRFFVFQRIRYKLSAWCKRSIVTFNLMDVPTSLKPSRHLRVKNFHDLRSRHEES